MTTEQKAKAYDEALEIAKKNYEAAQDLCNYSQIGVECFKNTLTNIFPELAESEDERTRKGLIQFIKNWKDPNNIGRPHDFPTLTRNVEQCDRYIAWLEKQSNKSVNIDIESMVSSYKQRLRSQGGIENSPLVNMCLTAFRHGVENALEELNLKKLEKQGEQNFDYEHANIPQKDFAPSEPKFKV